RLDDADDRARSAARPAARGRRNDADQISRHGAACRRVLPERSAPRRDEPRGGGNGSPPGHAVYGDERESNVAAVLRFARREAEGGPRPGAARSQAFRRRWRALLTTSSRVNPTSPAKKG